MHHPLSHLSFLPRGVTLGFRLASARARAKLAVLALTLSLAFVLAPRLAAETIATGTLTGRVSEAGSKNYLQGAEVAIEGTTIHTTVERDGSFQLNNVPVGTQTVTVTYPGLEPKNESIEIKAGETATGNFVLGDNIIQLEKFTVRGAKEGMSQAVALQKLSIQTKLVAAADQFGPVSEGNIGEYLKFLPGVTIDYNVNDARGISLRGLSTAFTIVAVDGTSITRPWEKSKLGTGSCLSSAVPPTSRPGSSCTCWPRGLSRST